MKGVDVEIGIGFRIYVALWVVAALALIFFWADLPELVRWPLSLLEAIFAPDLGSLRAIFAKRRAPRARTPP